MTKKVSFRTVTPSISKAVQERLFELGYGWPGNTVMHTDSHHITINWNVLGEMTYDTCANYIWEEESEKGSLDDLFNTEKYKLRKPIIIGEHEVEFKDDGVKVGCTFVDKKTVKKIYKKLFNK